jgi:hypothetical protein
LSEEKKAKECYSMKLDLLTNATVVEMLPGLCPHILIEDIGNYTHIQG